MAEIQVDPLIQEISETLQESNIELLNAVLKTIGDERTRDFFQRAKETEAGGGLMIVSGKRKRSPGGVFFFLVRQGVSKQERQAIFPPLHQKGQPQVGPGQEPPVQPPSWADVQAYVTALLKKQIAGEAKSVKLTIIGRPKQVAKAKTCMVCMLEGREVPKGMPKGLPMPPAGAKQSLAVFISSKQWSKVEASLKENKEDELLIEGWPYFDPVKGATVVLAQGVTTKFIQRASRQPNGKPAPIE